MITIQDFKKVELKVGKIVKVEDHPDADKLMILRVDVGEDKLRTLVAGLKDYYADEELEGKYTVVVTNLEPARLRGVRSEGMVLAAQESEDKVIILSPEEPVEPGSPVL
ncbi:MAG: methionine--tRNA ligase subunit beta [Planctomycetota bacterium]